MIELKKLGKEVQIRGAYLKNGFAAVRIRLFVSETLLKIN